MTPSDDLPSFPLSEVARSYPRSVQLLHGLIVSQFGLRPDAAAHLMGKCVGLDAGRVSQIVSYVDKADSARGFATLFAGVNDDAMRWKAAPEADGDAARLARAVNYLSSMVFLAVQLRGADGPSTHLRCIEAVSLALDLSIVRAQTLLITTLPGDYREHMEPLIDAVILAAESDNESTYAFDDVQDVNNNNIIEEMDNEF